ncbi:MAG: DinB family protein [Planctomycetota bacterium]
MANPQGELLAHNVMNAQTLFERFLAGFDDSNRTSQAPSLPNHLTWTLGHLAITAHRGAHRVLGLEGLQPLPADDFLEGDRGNTTHYATEAVSFGSQPIDDPGAYPSIERGLEVMHAAHETLAEALRNADDASLDRETPWGASTVSVTDLALRMGFHIGTHTGQIVDLRRALGLGSVLQPGLSKPQTDSQRS